MLIFNENGLRSLFLIFILQYSTTADKIENNNCKTDKTLGLINQSVWKESYKKIIIAKQIPQIQPGKTETTATSAAGNHSNYISAAAAAPTSGSGDSKQLDPDFIDGEFKKGGNRKITINEVNINYENSKGNTHNKHRSDENLRNNIINQHYKNPYHENPQKRVLVDCRETNAKTYDETQTKIDQNDMVNNDNEEYPAIKSLKVSKNIISPNLSSVKYNYDNLEKGANISEITGTVSEIKPVIKSIVERDVPLESNKKIIKKQDLAKSKPKYDIKSDEYTKTIYNPTILDSSDEHFDNKIYNKSVEGTQETINASYTGSVWQETEKNKPGIRFSDLPQRERYLTPSLKFEENPYPFEFVSAFFTVIYPYDVPIGLIRDIFWGNFSFPYSLLKSIKLESTFLACVVLMVFAALFIPTFLMCRAVLSLCKSGRHSCEEAGLFFPAEDQIDCKRRLRVATSLLVMILCGACIAGMAFSNESAAAAVEVSRAALRCACSDLSVWIAAAARDLRHVLVLPADLVLAQYRDDLNGVDPLLGEPIQKAIASESGVDLVLDSVNDITTESTELSLKISSLRDLCVKGSQLAVVTSERLRDISRQLNNLKKYCQGRDAPLCDTIQSGGFELQIKFDLILHEQQLLQLRSLGAENLTRAATKARHEFRALPAAIASQTIAAREAIARDMEARRNAIHKSSRVLGDMVRHLSAALTIGSRTIDAVLIRLREYDFWRWAPAQEAVAAVLLTDTANFTTRGEAPCQLRGEQWCCAVVAGFVIFLMACGLVCGCGKAGKHAKRTLQVSIGWMCITSLGLWTVVAAAFLVSGHAEVYVCRALWDGPEYRTLSRLLDRPSLPSRSPGHEGTEGVLDELFGDLDNVTVNVPVRDIIRECEQDRPAYSVFRLDRVLDINKETAYFEWSELQEDLKNLSSSVDVSSLKSVSLELRQTLMDMLRVSYVNMAHYRLQFNGPLVNKDMTSLAEQLENVATQLADLATSARIEALASRTRRLLVSSISPLEQLRTELVYKLTELELQLVPFHRQLNMSLSHIHTMQYYIDNQGDMIAQKKVSVYTGRLLSHTAGWRTHALSTAGTRAARCRPLFTIFSATRSLLCSRYVASLNGFWLCAMCCATLWCYAVPSCLQLCSYFDKTETRSAVHLTNLNASQQEISTICEENIWNTPEPPPPPDGNW